MMAQPSLQPVTSGSPPKLDTSTRDLLDDFLNRKRKEKVLFEHLKSRSSSRSATTTGSNKASSPSSSASSISSRRKRKDGNAFSTGRDISELFPRGRSGKGHEDELEDDEASMIAQVEALADLERLNGFEPSMPTSFSQAEVSDDEDREGADSDEGDDDNAKESDEKQIYQMDVDEFRRYFGERWQLSQFWYSSQFSYRLARSIHATLKAAIMTKPLRVGFVCCPTAYVAFQHLYPEASRQRPQKDNDNLGCNGNSESGFDIESFLFEYDERFALLAPPQSALSTPGAERFVIYDLNKPLSIPSSLEAQFDLVIIDPPYLNKETNLNLAQTVKKLVRDEESKVLLITGESISEQACEIYGNPKTGRLRRSEKLGVEHMGLANNFGVWGNWDGVESFGSNE